MLGTHRVWPVMKSIYLRVTLNWVTMAFFLFSFIHCFTQGIIQSFLYSADDSWGALTTEITAHANLRPTVFPQYTGRHGKYSLELCDEVPVAGGVPHPCDPFFTVGQSGPFTVPPRFLALPQNSSAAKRDASSTFGTLGQSNSNATSLQSVLQGSGPPRDLHIESQTGPDGLTNVSITSTDGSVSVTLDTACTLTLLYPQAKLRQGRREELSLIGSQFWFFGLAVFALVFESIPHILALIIARTLATAWSAFALWRTMNLADRMEHLIEGPGSPCNLGLLGPYFTRRFGFRIADLVLHVDALVFSVYLSWRLIKMYRTVTFRRVGPPKNILRMYAYFLAVLVSIQLSVFILVNAMSLWIDDLFNGTIKRLSGHTVVYDGTFIISTVLLIPWLMMGWFSIRREMRRLTGAFVAVAFFFIFAWSMMFYSHIYRFTFFDWPFFGCMTMASFLALVSSTVFSLVCLRNYNKGLAQWIYLEQKFGRDDFEPDLFSTEVIEKEWKQNADRASIYKASLPELLRDASMTA